MDCARLQPVDLTFVLFGSKRMLLGASHGACFGRKPGSARENSCPLVAAGNRGGSVHHLCPHESLFSPRPLQLEATAPCLLKLLQAVQGSSGCQNLSQQPGCLKTRAVHFLSALEARSRESRYRQGLDLLQTLGEDPSVCLPASGVCWLPWRSLACRHFTPILRLHVTFSLCLFMSSFPLCVSASLSKFLLFVRTPVIWDQGHPVDLMLT